MRRRRRRWWWWAGCGSSAFHDTYLSKLMPPPILFPMPSCNSPGPGSMWPRWCLQVIASWLYPPAFDRGTQKEAKRGRHRINSSAADKRPPLSLKFILATNDDDDDAKDEDDNDVVVASESCQREEEKVGREEVRTVISDGCANVIEASWTMIMSKIQMRSTLRLSAT